MKKSFALFLAILMVLSVFPLVATADGENEELDHMISLADEWTSNTLTNLSWLSEGDLDLSMTAEEKLIFDVSYNGKVLDVTLKGKTGGNDKAWEKAWQNAFLQSPTRNEIFYSAKYSDSFNDLGEFILTYSGNDDEFNKVFDNDDVQVEHNGFSDMNNIRFHGFEFPIAQVSRDTISNEITIIPNNNDYLYHYIGILDENNQFVAQKILIIYIHCDENIEICETTEEYVPKERVSLAPLCDSEGHEIENPPIKLEYDEETGLALICYSGTNVGNPEKILEEIHVNNTDNDPEDSSMVNVTIAAPDGYYTKGWRGTWTDKDNTSIDITSIYILRGEFNRSTESYTLVWYNKESETDIIIEKINVGFESPSMIGKTWMDSVCSPTDESRITYKYRNDDIWQTITPGDLSRDYNMNVSYVGEKTGLLYISFPDDEEVTAYKLNGLCAEIEPIEGATHYTINQTGGDGWAVQDNDVANDQKNLLRDKKKQSIAEKGNPCVGIDRFESFECGTSTIFYTKHTDGNEVTVIWWWDDEHDEPIGSDYIYTYVEDYLWVVESNTYNTESDITTTPVEYPVVVGKGLGDPKNKIKVQLFPQEGEDGYYLKLVEKGGWEAVKGEEYVVYFPFHYFGFKNLTEAEESGSSPIIYHMTNANTVKETLTGTFTKYGVKFVVGDFSPFYGFASYYSVVDKDGKLKDNYITLSEALENADDTDTVVIKRDDELELEDGMSLNLNIATDSDLSVYTNDGSEIYVDGENKGESVIIKGTGKNIEIETKPAEEKPHIPTPVKKSTTKVDIFGISKEASESEENPNTGAEGPYTFGIIAAAAVMTAIVCKIKNNY